MAKKKDSKVNEIKLTEKEKKQIKENIMDEIKDDLTVELSKSLVNEVNKSFDVDYKEELKSRISDEISDNIKSDFEKEEKRKVRGKNFKIFRLYLYIIILLCIIGFVFYKMYKTDNLDIIGIKKLGHSNINITTLPTTEEDNKKAKLLEKYKDILANVKIKNTYYINGNILVDNLTTQEKFALAYNTLSEKDIEKDGSFYTLESTKLENAYKNLFGLDDYQAMDFSSDGKDFKYSAKTNYYLALNETETDNVDVIMNIESIDENDEYVYVDVITAIRKGDFIYSKDNLNASVTKYKDTLDLSQFKNKLTTNRVVFKKSLNNTYLYAIY